MFQKKAVFDEGLHEAVSRIPVSAIARNQVPMMYSGIVRQSQTKNKTHDVEAKHKN